MSRFNRFAKVTSSISDISRIGWSTFRSVIYFLIAAAFVLGVVSPALGQVFSDQAKAGVTASQVTSKATLKEVGPMAFSRSVNEWTASLRSQLETPIANKLDPLSNGKIVRTLHSYEKGFAWNGSVSPQLTALFLGGPFFVVVLPPFLFFSKRSSFRYALSVMMVSVAALVLLTQPLSIMTMDQASKAVVVNQAFLGNSSFQSLQTTSQQELVDRPAAQAALGADGQTLAGERYVAKLHDGLASKAELALYKNSRSNPIKAMIVAAPTVITAVVDAIIQLPLIGLAVVAELAISLLMTLDTIFGLGSLLLPKPVRRSLRRHLKHLVKWTTWGYALLFGAVLFVTASAQFSALIARFMNNGDIGLLATVGTGVSSLIVYSFVFWLIRKGAQVVIGHIPSVKASRALAASSRQGESQDDEQKVVPTRKRFNIGLASRT